MTENTKVTKSKKRMPLKARLAVLGGALALAFGRVWYGKGNKAGTTKRSGFMKRLSKFAAAALLLVTFGKLGATGMEDQKGHQEGSSRPKITQETTNQNGVETVHVPAMVTKYGCPPMRSKLVRVDPGRQSEPVEKHSVSFEDDLEVVHVKSVKHARPSVSPKAGRDR